MFRQMRRQERAMTQADTDELLRTAQYGVLSINGAKYPYGVPLSYAVEAGNIYLHMATAGLKLDLLRAASYVSFCVVGEVKPLAEQFSMVYQSVIVFGHAEELSGADKNQALERLLEKYSPEYLEKGRQYIKNAGERTIVYKITIEHSSGKCRAE